MQTKELQKVDREALVALKEAWETKLLTKVQAQDAETHFNLMLAEAYTVLKMPIEQSALCLSCGCAYSRHAEKCPGCTA